MRAIRTAIRAALAVGWTAAAAAAGAQASTDGRIVGQVVDETRAVLPGVTVTAQRVGESSHSPSHSHTDGDGRYSMVGLAAGRYEISFRLINFSHVTRTVDVVPGAETVVDVVLQLSMRADVTVTGRRTFRNLADVENPRESLIGVASAASQGAVTAAQLATRPIMRAGEVLEAVPGVIISQHSGEGKANQYYLRGFNLDHGTDFSTSVAGVPVNLPSHGHGHGYTDLNFLIPELVSGALYTKGPYYADQGDFSTAGSTSINYVNALEAPLVRLSAGELGWARGLAAVSPRLGTGTLLLATELAHNDGPWRQPDDYRRLNGVVRYSQGDSLNGLSLTAMGYRATWDATDQVPQRAVRAGALDRFDGLDPSAGGATHRYSLAAEIQRSGEHGLTKAAAFVLDYRLNLFSNFTYLLDNPVDGDQFEQADDRVVSGARVSHRRLQMLGGRSVEHGFGVQLRHDHIGNVGLYRTTARRRLETVRQDRVGQTSVGIHYEGEVEWTPVLRSTIGLRADLYRFDVDSSLAANSGRKTSGLVSPKGGLVAGPWKGTEVYVNAGLGFHSNDARGVTMTVDPLSRQPADSVTPLVRGRGAEIGVRTVAVPRVQSTFTLWSLALDSELVFVGDAGTTEASRPSRRFGVEWSTYVRPRPWLTIEADLSASRARFTDADPAGDRVPGSVGTVGSLTASLDGIRGWFGGARLRHFGPRALVEDDRVRSKATSLLNLQGGYEFKPGVRAVVDLFNAFDAKSSDIDYFYRSRLVGEPAAGVDDVHFHPTLPRSVRVGLQWDF